MPECSLASSMASRVSFAKHHDVRAGAEDALLQRRDDDCVHLGVFEADALNRIGQLDVDAEIIGIELQLVVGRETGVFAHVHRKRGDWAVERQFPVLVGLGACIKGDH